MGKDIRYGKSSQLSISLENGTWHNFESNQSGNLYQLVMQEQKVGFKQALNLVGDHVSAYRQDPTKIQNVLENAQVTQGQEAKGKTTAAATHHKSPPRVKTPEELEDEKPFVGTEKQKMAYLDLCKKVKDDARLLDEDKIKLIRLAKGNIAQGLKTWEQQHDVWAKEQNVKNQSDLEKRIEYSEDIPDSYKLVYLEDAKRDPIGTLAKIMKIEENARDIRLKEAAIATANPISAPRINSNSEISRDPEKKVDTVVAAPEVLPQNDKALENLPHDHILTNVDKNTAIVAKVEAPGVTQEKQPQTAQKGEGQERQNDQPKVMVEKDRTEIAATSNAASSQQESAAHASGVESVRSATETTSVESQKEVTLDQAPAVLSPKQQALAQDYEKIRNYLTLQGDDVSIIDQHYRNNPEHAISFYKGLFERRKSFAQHMAQADKLSATSQKETTLEKAPAVLSPKQKALHQDYEKIRNYLTLQGDDVSIIDQHYRNDPEHAISFYKGLFERSKSFAQHMARPDVQNTSTKEMASALIPTEISNLKKADDLIEKIHKTETLYLNFREPMKSRTEAREQLKDLYTEASKNSMVMDRLKEHDPKLQARIEEHVQPQKSKSWGLEL